MISLTVIVIGPILNTRSAIQGEIFSLWWRRLLLLLDDLVGGYC